MPLAQYLKEHQKAPWWSSITSAPSRLLGWCLSLFKKKQTAENNVCKLNETYEAQIKGMTEHAKSLNEMNSEELKKETEKMAAYIELLNKQYSQMLNAMNVKTGK